MGMLLAVLLALAQTKPATTWNPAASDNYTTVSYDRSIQYVVIHTIEGSYSGAISWFKNSSSNVSAHYVVSFGGAITQMVADKNIAWHAGNSYYNAHSIGIEHEGYAYRNYWTDAEYRASAALTRWACFAYGIPMDRSHIIGHVEVPGATHTDPGPYFNWTYYMSLVRGGSAPPPPSPTLSAKQCNTASLNVRSGPSTGNSIIGTIASGQRYVAIASQSGWYQIYYRNNTGWCSGSYLTGITGVTGVRIDTASLNVRTGPSTGYGIVGTASSGQRYVQITTSGGWRRIYWGGGAYWVSGTYASAFGL
ncbi:MAG TPA: N-acetylmuramoyl-L-alanine amidase [Planctomycetota bacterium]|nr:N-acetylmuramoyl-L-alanine amidase [Planctomycetota bacterium]